MSDLDYLDAAINYFADKYNETIDPKEKDSYFEMSVALKSIKGDIIQSIMLQQMLKEFLS